MTGERILITGAQGFVGRYAVAEAIARGAEVLGLGRSTLRRAHFTHEFSFGGRLYPVSLPAEAVIPADAPYRYQSCDLRSRANIQQLISRFRPDRVIHLAGSLRDSDTSSLAQNNRMATANLVGALARLASDALVIIGSSGAVYGRQAYLPIAEEATPHPVGEYAHSKLEMELATVEAARGTGLTVSVARIFNLIGPGIQDRHLPGRLAHAIAEIEISDRDPTIELGDLSATRDLVDARDVARWLVTISRDRARSVANLASGEETSMQFVVDTLARLANKEIRFATKAEHNRVGADRSVARSSLAADCGALIPLAISLADTLDHARRCLELRSHTA